MKDRGYKYNANGRIRVISRQPLRPSHSQFAPNSFQYATTFFGSIKPFLELWSNLCQAPSPILCDSWYFFFFFFQFCLFVILALFLCGKRSLSDTDLFLSWNQAFLVLAGFGFWEWVVGDDKVITIIKNLRRRDHSTGSLRWVRVLCGFWWFFSFDRFSIFCMSNSSLVFLRWWRLLMGFWSQLMGSFRFWKLFFLIV